MKLLHVGVQISGDFALIVGESATISCITDLNVEILEWVHGDSVLANSTSQQLDLTFDLVTDLHHGKAYICRATTTYGSQERNITLTVQSMCFCILHKTSCTMVVFNSERETCMEWVLIVKISVVFLSLM